MTGPGIYAFGPFLLDTRHFRNSDQEGSSLGRKVGRYVTEHYFQPRE